ncbi:3-isopropylmalate dehydratase small subunit [Halosegnis longus]|uniref:3-isopropylmalate dehydratase small subunit n=1 Tax=Halosegnis longus TaxID=2216012 RepID=UPI00096A2520|nr:3-isopropylmalate dehydratase small subunit [Salella cibi]
MVRSITRVTGTGIPVRGDDIDTDQIVPARFLKEITFDDMGEYAFYDARRDDEGNLNDHPFNEYHGANILVVNDNFGCGSSREHAPQALMRWGIRAIVGESFAEIFRDNCKSLGIPTVTADTETVDALQSFIESSPDAGIEVDIEDERVVYDGSEVGVGVDPSMKEALVEGKWDTTALMYQNLPETRKVANELPYIDAE